MATLPVALTYLLCALWLHATGRLGVTRQLHHALYGTAVVLLGVPLGWPLWVLWAGVGVLADDALQHTLQLYWRASFTSPLWYLGKYAFYVPLAWVRECVFKQ